MAGDGVTIVIRADNGQAVRAMRDTQGRLRDLSGRFVSEGRTMSTAMQGVGTSIGNLKGWLIPLATAAAPVTAALTPIAGAAGAAGVAVAAFGAAVAGQVGSLSDAADAQSKYGDAVAEYGRGSAQAAKAQRAVQVELAGMPRATQRASIALGTLKDDFSEWSDEMAAFTMQPVEKSFTVLGRTVPKLTGLTKGASREFDRLITLAGGAITTPGFDRLVNQLTVFSNEVLADAVDGILRFGRVLSEGDANGPLQSFIEYANANGPALRDTLSSIGDAVSTLVEAAAQAGPGMLTLVNAAAQMVAALPPELVATVMQLAVGLKLVSLAGAGLAATSTAVATLGTRLAGLQAASVAAGGGLTGLAAAFGTLGKAAKASIVVAGLAAIVVGVKALADIGKEAPPDVDKLTESLSDLGRTGNLSGEGLRVLGEDFSKLHDVLGRVADPSVSESVANWGADISGGILRAGDSTEELIEKMDGVDDALTNLVKNGNADLARAAIERMTEGMSAAELEEFEEELDNYDEALADANREAELVAASMGIFGDAAQDTTAKLEAQKGAADGLRQSILALNEVNRSAHDAQTAFEGSLDELTEAFKEHGATLNADTEAGRANRDAMSAAAKAHDELLSAGIAAGESLDTMVGKSQKLRGEMMKLAVDAFDGNRKKAEAYVNTLLGVPSEVRTLIKAEQSKAIEGLKQVQAAIEETPGEKTVTVETLNSAAIQALEEVGLKTERLPDGRTRVTTSNGAALGSIGSVRRAMDRLNGKVARTRTNHYVNTYYNRYYKSYYRPSDGLSFLGASGRYARGGLVRGYAQGGGIQAFPTGGMVVGPGTGTSDSIPALVSNGEFVMRAGAVAKYGTDFMDAINNGQVPRFAGGGRTLGGTAGGAGGPMVLEIRSGGSRFDDLLVEVLRKAVRVRGGNVQLVLGRG